jgi:hypothetical protein
VFKSLFTSHQKAHQQNRAHWITYNPFYNWYACIYDIMFRIMFYGTINIILHILVCYLWKALICSNEIKRFIIIAVIPDHLTVT